MKENQIDLWLADLDVDDRFEQQACALLSPDELDRAQRFRFPIHKRRYVVRRGILRLLLGRYLDNASESISIAYGAHGKPFVRDVPLHFSLSHSEDRACFAFSSSSPLGVDVERVRPIPDLLRVAESFCSPAELSEIASRSPEEQPLSFFRCWTRKEALVKALGTGLSYPLKQIDVSSAEAVPLPCVQNEHEERMRWHLHSWEMGSGYLGALATGHSEARIVLHRFAEF